MKLCSKCKEWKERGKFNKSKCKIDGLQSKCKECSKRYSIEWYNNNKEHKLKKSSNYDKFNALYEQFVVRLTIDESPRLAQDGVSLEVKCRYCGRYFIPTNSEVKHRITALDKTEGDKSLYCSVGCKKSCPIYGRSDYSKSDDQGTSREVQPQLRQMVLLRDDYICQKCGSEDELHCHHIWPLNESPTTSADIDECITLCKSCHKKVHKIPGCGLGELKCSI